MRILHVTPSYYPATAWGGPIFSTKAICDGVAALPGVEIEVLTTNAAGPHLSEALSLSEHSVRFLAGYTVRYCRRVALNSASPELLKALPSAVKWADVVHLTGTYSFPTIPTLATARWYGKPLVWSPRGAIQATEEWQGAPRRKAKRAFEAAAAAVAPRKMALHVTSDAEDKASSPKFPAARVAVIPNAVELPSAPAAEARKWRPAGTLRLVFLSRVHPKKGIELLLRALAELPNSVTLDVFGTGEPSYLRSLNDLVHRLGIGERVRMRGHVDGPKKQDAFDNADIFVLPTYSENFGIVVAEALAHGVPVITTKHAPWSGLVTHDCGAWITADYEQLRDSISSLMTRDLRAMGHRGRLWIQRDFSEAEAALKHHRLYRQLLDE